MNSLTEKIVLLGFGNLGFHLANSLLENECNIIQIYNRSPRSFVGLPRQFKKIKKVGQIEEITAFADVYIIAVSDNSIANIAESLSDQISPEALVVHTSGSVSMNILKPYFTNYGSFYPLQSFRRERELDFSQIPILFNANNDESLARLDMLGKHLSFDVFPMTDEDRSRLHVPAVFVNNFVNYLYHQALEYCLKEGIPFEFLFELIFETTDRILSGELPSEMQTGPAWRGDNKTLESHRKLLENHPESLKVYNHLTKRIQKLKDEDNP